MVRVGKYKIIHSVTFLQLAGNDAIVSFEVFGEEASFRIRFLIDEDAKDRKHRQFEAGPDPDHEERGLLTFTNWNKPTLTSISEPYVAVQINAGEEDEKNISAMGSVQYFDEIYSVHLQFMVEDSL